MKINIVMLVFAVCLCVISESKAVTYSASCGANVMCSYDTLTGVLTVSGSGNMSGIPASFNSYKSTIHAVVIPDGITSIGDYAFYGATSLTNVNIPDSVTSIGIGAFSRCTSLTSVNIPNSVTSIGDYAFYGATSLTNVNMPLDSSIYIGEGAFPDSTNISCPDGYVFADRSCVEDKCEAGFEKLDGECVAKLRYTMEEADAATSDDNENMIEWIFE